MERLYRGFEIITNRVHTSNQQRHYKSSGGQQRCPPLFTSLR
ncbi:hypothetical protein PN456_04755 [Nodularia spumigena CS-586/05]|nr:hypothetical protein [Nodularia spumigena CS-588/06]MDB9368272.1 hypothetical protein [Nodularia spumigena CS-586/05]